MSRRLSLLAAGLAASIMAALAPVAASGGVEKLERDSASAREKVEQITGQLNDGRADYQAASQRAEASSAREARMSLLLANGAERAATLEQRVAASRAGLKQARERLARARRVLSDRLVAIYMSGTPELSVLILGASDYGDLASRDAYLEAVSEADARLASRVREVRGEFETEVGRLDRRKAAADAHVAALGAARAGIVTARSAAENAATSLASENSTRQSEIGQLRSDISAWEKEIRKREAVSSAEAEEEVAQTLGGPYAIPTYIVICESGGNYAALNPSSGAGGAYQILPSTWEAYGGEGLPHEASKSEQDRIAGLIFAESGTSPWVCG
ncbi:MAG: transglycosylase family protein [Acidobacteriota bacterium]